MSETMLRAICLTVLTSASRLCRCLNFDRTGGALNRKSPKASKKRQSEGKLKREGATMGRKKGAALAQAILQNCERDYTTLQQVFGGLTPQRMPFVVQVNSGATGASHSRCIGTDIAGRASFPFALEHERPPIKRRLPLWLPPPPHLPP